MRFYKAMQDVQVRKLVSAQLPALKIPVEEHPFGGEYVGGHGEYTPFEPEFGTGYFGGFSSLHQESPEIPKGNPTVKVTPKLLETPTGAKPTENPQTPQTPKTAKLQKEEEKDKPSEPTSPTSPAAAK